MNNLLDEGKAFLGRDFYLDAEVLLAHLLNTDRVHILTGDYSVNETQVQAYKSMLARRKNGEPVAYITNHCEFMGLDFYVDQNVLIPRPDTETAVETALSLIKEHKLKSALDLCTGSCCIAVSLSYYAKIKTAASDISEAALSIARKNAERHNCNIELFQGNMFEPFRNTEINYKFDLIISNPPYIDENEMNSLPLGVQFEPQKALYGGHQGLDFYKIIARDAWSLLSPNGFIILEIGYNQADLVVQLFRQNNNPIQSRVIKDLAGLDRVIILNSLHIS